MSRRSRLFVSTQVKDWGQSPLSRVPNTDVPLDVSTLSPDLWLDASDTSTITESGGAVSQWDNKGSLGDFTQATAALQPTTGTTTLNGLNVIDFAGDYLTAANTNEWKFLHDGTKCIIAWAWKAGTGSDPNAAYSLLGNNLGNSLPDIGFSIWYDDRAGSSRNNALAFSASANNANYVGFVMAQNTLTPNTAQVVSAITDLGNGTADNRIEYFINAGAGLKGNTSTVTPSTSNPGNALQIGALGANVAPLTGYIAEIVIVSGANATETNRAALRDYLNDKWAVY